VSSRRRQTRPRVVAIACGAVVVGLLLVVESIRRGVEVRPTSQSPSGGANDSDEKDVVQATEKGEADRPITTRNLLQRGVDILAGASFCLALLLLLYGAREGVQSYMLIGIVPLAVSLVLFVFSSWRRSPIADDVKQVGELADVLGALGQEIRAANMRHRERDSIKWNTGELTLDVKVEGTASGGFSFKVVNGGVGRRVSRTTTIKLNLWPADTEAEGLGGM
jgi:hypothetical protein